MNVLFDVIVQFDCMMKATQQTYKGFLISCDKNREKEAVRDAYNFLEEYIHAIYSDVTEQSILKKLKKDGKDLTLENEVKQRKASEHRLLSQFDTNVNCLCFIKINPAYKQIDPLVVVSAIMKDVHKEGRLVTRFCHRILPVEKAFKAEHFRMIQELQELLYQHTVPEQIKSWRLNFKCRNNNKFNYKEVLKEVELLTKKYQHFPDIYYPQWTISVEIANHLMCLSITEDFQETNQFKLHTSSKQLEAHPPFKNPQEQKPKAPQNSKGPRRQSEIGLNRQQGIGLGQQKEQGQPKQQNKEQLLIEKFEKRSDDIDLF